MNGRIILAVEIHFEITRKINFSAFDRSVCNRDALTRGTMQNYTTHFATIAIDDRPLSFVGRLTRVDFVRHSSDLTSSAPPLCQVFPLRTRFADFN